LRILTLIVSMKITAYNTARVPSMVANASAIPSITRSVIAVIVCFDKSAPYTSARCAAISRASALSPTGK
jgi:hypothetical protein